MATSGDRKQDPSFQEPKPLPAAHRLGLDGETFVAHWLHQRGWQILAQRWRCKSGELDVVAWDYQTTPPTLAFIEVKTRRPGSLDQAGRLSLTPQKQRRLWRSAETFLLRYPQYAHAPCRFDLALVQQTPTHPPTLTLLDYLTNVIEG